MRSLFVGDGDEFALLADLRSSFGVELTKGEGNTCRTMGDLEGIVWQKIAAGGGYQDRCMTAMGFYHLRRAFAKAGLPRKIRPSDTIKELGMTSRRMRRMLNADLRYVSTINDSGRFRAVRTAGEAARQLADQNFAHFAAKGGRYDRESVWRRLREIAANGEGYDPAEIGRDTLIIHPEKRWFQIFI